MPKFFVPKENINDDNVIVTGQDVSHILRVLRMSKGDGLCLCDGMGNNYNCVIDTMEDDKIVCNILEIIKADTEANIEVTLFQGIPKGSKMEYIIQKTTELGIVNIVPLKMARCVSKIESQKDAIKKQQRWQKIADEASKQSGRGVIPQVSMPVDFSDAVEMMKDYDLAFAPYECEEETCIKKVLLSKPDVKSVAFMIGPEGGYDAKEVKKLEDAGIQTVSLGKRILRTETAGEAVLAMIMYEIGDINR